jgi:hypothetical protein
MEYLCSFRPLAASQHGQQAMAAFNLPPFIDASCRREPDLESAFPSISALCRGPYFAPNLHVGDSVVYITVKGEYPGVVGRHWRLVAILTIVQSFTSHDDGAGWYRSQGLPLPSNCMVFGNPPQPLERTDYFEDNLQRWDAMYRIRARDHGIFHVCRTEFCELYQPPTLTDALMRDIFGRIPSTHTPPVIPHGAFLHLRSTAMPGLCQPKRIAFQIYWPSPMSIPQRETWLVRRDLLGQFNSYDRADRCISGESSGIEITPQGAKILPL